MLVLYFGDQAHYYTRKGKLCTNIFGSNLCKIKYLHYQLLVNHQIKILINQNQIQYITPNCQLELKRANKKSREYLYQKMVSSAATS